jgi:transposase-like protein
MAEKRRKNYSPEFRDEAVRMVLSGRHGGQAAIARELGVNPATLNNWVSRYRRSNPVAGEPLSVDERARLRELERENRELRQKNDFLGKAAAFFAQEYR